MPRARIERPAASRRVNPWLDPGEDGANLELEDFPSVMLMRVANAVQMQTTRAYSERAGLAPTEWRLLARLWRSAPMKFGELCRLSFLDKGHVSRTLRELQDRGLVATHPDPEHGRRQWVEITSEGRALVRRIMPAARRAQLRLLEQLDSAERKAMYSALRKLLSTTDGVDH